MPSQIYQKGHIINDRWQINKKIGEGQFAEVYEIKDQNRQQEKYALKIDKKKDVKTVKGEIKVLQQLSSNCSQVCDIVQHGVYDGLHFMVMTLLGLNLFDLRRENGGKLTIQETLKIGQSTLKILKQIHSLGYVHRDVKPANFAIYPPQAEALYGHWYVIDFGLTRRYLDQDDKHQLIRDNCQFRGTSTYASINAHSKLDLSRRDDLWSWLYMLVELIEGDLPWRFGEQKEREKTEITRDLVFVEKQNCIKEPSRLFKGDYMPKSIEDIIRYLDNLGFTDTPDYDFLDSAIQDLETMIKIERKEGQVLPENAVANLPETAISPSKQGNNKPISGDADVDADLYDLLEGKASPGYVDSVQQVASQKMPGTQGVDNSTVPKPDGGINGQIISTDGPNMQGLNNTQNGIVQSETLQQQNNKVQQQQGSFLEEDKIHSKNTGNQHLQSRGGKQELGDNGVSQTDFKHEHGLPKNQQTSTPAAMPNQRKLNAARNTSSPQYGKIVSIDEKDKLLNKPLPSANTDLLQGKSGQNMHKNGTITQQNPNIQGKQVGVGGSQNNLELNKQKNIKRKMEQDGQGQQQKLQKFDQAQQQQTPKNKGPTSQLIPQTQINSNSQRQQLLDQYTDFALKGNMQLKAHEILKDVRHIEAIEAQGVIFAFIKMLVQETNDSDCQQVIQMLKDISQFSNHYANEALVKCSLIKQANQ